MITQSWLNSILPSGPNDASDVAFGIQMRDVIVVGGGAVGLSAAYSLRQRGADVTLLESGRIAGGASGGNVGWITPTLAAPVSSPPSIWDSIRMALERKGPLIIGPAISPSLVTWLWQLWRHSRPPQLRTSTAALMGLAELAADQLDAYRTDGVEFEMHRAGLMVVGLTENGITWFLQLVDLLRELGFSGVVDVLDGEAAREREPALSHRVSCAAHALTDRFVRPESFCEGLAARLLSQGAEIQVGRRALRVRPSPRSVIVDTSTGPLEARSAVIAAGVDSKSLLRPLGVRLPITAAKGYTVTATSTQTAPRHSLYLSEPRIGVSPYNGAIRLGGFFELGPRSKAPHPRRTKRILEGAREYLDDLPSHHESSRVSAWAGCRPATPDSLPYIGRLPGAENVFVASGHGMLGITLAPATGALLARLITGGAEPPELRPFALAHRA